MAVTSATSSTPLIDARAALGAHLDAIGRRDLEAFASTVADEVLLVTAEGEVIVSRSEFLRRHAEWFAIPGWSVRADIRGELHASDFALFALDFRHRGAPDADEDAATLTLGFRRTPDGWKMAFDQNTP